jgi:repressor LexA
MIMPRRKKPSPRQERILQFIREFLEENDLPPTVRDIQTACSISSTSVVDYNLRLLQKEGYIRRRPDVARGIELVGAARSHAANVLRIPVMAHIAAGEPALALDAEGWSSGEPLDTIEVTPDMMGGKRDLYALKVRGTSMIDALVADGDIVLVEPSRQANNGAMVVARLKEENETTLKYLYREGDTVRLQPANEQMEPIYSHAGNVEVQGRVVGIIRLLR